MTAEVKWETLKVGSVTLSARLRQASSRNVGSGSKFLVSGFLLHAFEIET